MKLRVLQWNIWYKEHVDNIIAFLKETNADIICLQELTVGHELHNRADLPKQIAEALGMHYYFVPGHTFPTGYKIGNGIFSRYELANTQFYYVQHATSGPAGSEESRVYIQADIKAAQTVTVGTAHLSYYVGEDYSEKRLHEVEQLLLQLQTKQSRFVFTGDLNSFPESYTIKRISDVLTHCGPDFSKPTWPTKRYAPGPAHDGQLQMRLDYVFATPDMRVLNASIPLTGFSDHLPLCVDFEVTERREQE